MQPAPLPQLLQLGDRVPRDRFRVVLCLGCFERGAQVILGWLVNKVAHFRAARCCGRVAFWVLCSGEHSPLFSCERKLFTTSKWFPIPSMKPIVIFFAALALAGCATQSVPAAASATASPVQKRTVTITTRPVDAHVKLFVNGDRTRGPLAEGDTKDRRIQFAVPSHLSIVAEATAPGYEQRPYIRSEQMIGSQQAAAESIEVELRPVRE
jgi:hypothetical protein